MAHDSLSSSASHDRVVPPVGVFPLPGVDEEQYASALAALRSGEVGWVVVSGKMAAGKDTVAPQVVDVLPRSWGGAPVLLGYGDLMRAELAGVVEAYAASDREALSLAGRRRLARELTGLSKEHAADLVACLDAEFAVCPEGSVPSVFDRTENMRRMLQGLGGPWRTHDDPGYWARRAAAAALGHAAGGRSVVLTGARYLPDVEIPARLGAVLVRLDIARVTQLERLGARDGIAPTHATLAALDHPGETALDDWTGFTFRFSNEGPLEDTVLSVREALVGEFACRRASATV